MQSREVYAPGGRERVPVPPSKHRPQLHLRCDHTCGVTTANRAYCWGNNHSGQLGDGTGTTRLTPVAVAGGLEFRHVSAGQGHTCGLTRDDRAYCWGENNLGQLGDGTTTRRHRPVAVAGGLSFRQVSVGFLHSCGIDAVNHKALCWGSNEYGRLGDGSTLKQRLKPVPVTGGRSFSQLSAGWDHTCAVTPGARVFCWGNGSNGQIGDGKTYQRWTPRAVTGGLSFTRVSAGVFHTCGETTNNLPYCPAAWHTAGAAQEPIA